LIGAASKKHEDVLEIGHPRVDQTQVEVIRILGKRWGREEVLLGEWSVSNNPL